MTSFINIDYDRLESMDFFRQDIIKCGYYCCSTIYYQSYKHVSDKFILNIDFSTDYDVHLYICTSHLKIKINHFKLSDSIFIFKYSSRINKIISSQRITFTDENISDSFHNDAKIIADTYKDMLSVFPSLKDIMSFLDLIPDKHNSDPIKHMLTNRWKSGLELLIDYNLSTRLYLPMVII